MPFFPRKKKAPPRHAAHARPRGYLPRLELLEERALLATLSGDITSNLVLDNSVVHRVTADARVVAGVTLTMQPGAILKFNSGTQLTIEGTLSADGDAAQKIIFTSIQDDSAGGDTGGGGASTGFRGQWKRLFFAAGSTGNVLDNVEVRYAGGEGIGGADVHVATSSFTLTNSLLTDSAAAGLRITASNPTLTNNTIRNHVDDAAIRMDLASSPSISGVTLSGNVINGVRVDAGSLVGNVTWNNPDIVYRLSGNTTVPAGQTLTIGAGQIIKGRNAQPDQLIVNGTLIADGTEAQPILFTVSHDDSAGGDTDNNGPSSAFNGAWGGLQINAGAIGNLLDYVRINFAGGWGPVAALVTSGGLTMTNSTVRQSGTVGVRILASNPTLADLEVVDCTQSAISMDLASNPAITAPVLTGNPVNAVRVDQGSLTVDAVWDDPDVVYWLPNDVTVPAGRTLTIGAGQVIKARAFTTADALTVAGTLKALGTAAQPILFTSDFDDGVGGDTTNNGASAGFNGAWGGVGISAGSTGSILEHVEMRFGGGNGVAQLRSAGQLTLRDSLLHNYAIAGLRVIASSPLVEDTIFQNLNTGIAAVHAVTADLASSPTISATIAGNVNNFLLVDSGTMNASQTWAGAGLPYRLAGNVTLAAGVTLTVAAGATYDALDNRGLLGATGTLAVAGAVQKSTGGGNSTIAAAVVNAGDVNVQSGTLNFTNTLTTNGSGRIRGAATATLSATGDLLGGTKNLGQFAPQLRILLNGATTSANPQELEVLGADRGSTAAGFDDNFVFNNLALAATNTYVQLVDLADNAQGAGAEALYVNNLTVPAGTTLDLNGFKLYARNSSVAGTIVNGSVGVLPDGGPLLRDVSAPGKIAVNGEVDDWTIFGRAGDTLTITLTTGGGGITPALAPTLDFGQVKVIDPDGNEIAVQSNSTSGADVTIAGLSLPADGVYHLRVQARPLNPTRTGNYVLTAWNAAVFKSPLVLSQRVVGDIDTPFRIDRYTFSGAAGQVVRFDHLAAESAAIQFDLTGPNAFTAFSNSSADSAEITLPTAGTYSLTVHGSQLQTGAYAFRLEQVSVTDLTLGTPHTGALAGGAQSQLFRVNVPDVRQLQVTLADADASHRNEVYVKYGSAPTRADFQYKFATPASAAQQVFVPSAAPGDWFVLVYTERATQPGAFEIRVDAASVFLSEVTPARAGTGADAVLTLAGIGFDGTTTVSLVSASNFAYPASAARVDLPTQMTATFAAGYVPAGVYSVRVTRGATTATLPGAVTFVAGGQAKLEAKVVLPDALGYHVPATIFVEYGNAGDVAMPAPLLILHPTQTHADGSVTDGALLTLDPSRVTAGFWTSAVPEGFRTSMEFLAHGATPGVLQPGEKVRVPIYYAGWKQPWDLSYPAFNMNLGVITAESAAAVDWASLQTGLRPDFISEAGWDALYPNFVARLGSTWGSVVSRFSQDAQYLGSIGRTVSDLGDLWAFQIQQANGVGPVPTLLVAVDARVQAPGQDLALARSFGSSIADRNRMGPFGWGWKLSGAWGQGLATQADGTVIITNADGSQRLFKPDSRAGRGYFSEPGDPSVLTAVGGGVFTLTDPDGQVTRFSGGKVEYIQDANGNRHTATYAADRLSTITAAGGASLTLNYNAAGRISSVANSLGEATQFTYDASNQYLLTATDFAGRTTTYEYTTGGSAAVRNALLSATSSEDTRFEFTYDAQGRLASTSGAAGAQATHFSYGAGGAVTATDLNAAATVFSYDHRGLLARRVDPLQRATYYAHDRSGNLVQITDALGQDYQLTRDSRGRMTRSTSPLGATNQFTFDPAGRLASFTDPKGNTTRLTYDAKGNVVGVSHPDGATESAAYDALGQLSQFTDGNGSVTDYTYNAAGQVLTKSNAPAGQTTRTYDAKGSVATVVDANGTTTFTHDDAGRLEKVSNPDGTFVEYEYDAAGRRSKLTDHTGFGVRYQYNALGQLAGLADGAGAPLVTYTYDALGRLTEIVRSNGTRTEHTFDASGGLTAVVNKAPDGAVNSRFDYTYNALGVCTSMTTLDGVWTYTYDAVGQLTRAVFTSNNPAGIPNQDLQYRYDAAGNRTETVLNGATTAYTVNQRNQYVQVGSTTHAFDRNGNRISTTSVGGTTAFQYDAGNQLVAIQPAGGTPTTLTYDGFGNLIRETTGVQQTRKLIDVVSGSVVAEFDQGGGVVAHYLQGHGLAGRIDGAGAASYYDFDGIGSTAGVTGPAGQYVAAYSYQPFGELLRSSGTLDNPFQFIGQWGVSALDGGLHHMGARAYSAAEGRFAEVDPLGIRGGGLNLYAYANNSPVNYTDPSGLDWKESLVLGGAAVIGGTLTATVGVPMLIATGTVAGVLAGTAMIPIAGVSVGLGIQKVASGIIGRGEPIAGGVGGLLDRVYGGDGKIGDLFDLGTGLVGSSILEKGFKQGTKAVEILGDVSGAIGVGDTLGNTYKELRGNQSPPLPTAAIVAAARSVGQGQSQNVASRDPNDKIGPAGFGTAHYVGAGQVLPYRVNFENDAEASAPAQRVTITDQLSADFDWDTFAFTEFGFGDTIIPVIDRTHNFQTEVSMTYNDKTFNVEVYGELRSATGEIFVSFQSIDPEFGLPPDALTGFLPPEDGTGRGQGYFTYTIRADAGLAHGTAIRNVALIVFDDNPSIATNQVDPHDPSAGTDPDKEALVTIDRALPTSAVAALPLVSGTTSFSVSWSGADVGAGVAKYDVYVSVNGGAFTLWLDDTTATAALYPGAVASTYAFYSLAVDNVGNEEAPPATADAQTRTPVYEFILPDVGEDAKAPPAVTVAQLLGTHFADADANAKPGIAITTANGPGTWQYSANGKTWLALGAVSPQQAKLLPAGYRVRFLPARHVTGSAGLLFHAWDGSLGTAGGTFPLLASGGSAAFSLDAALAGLQVTAVNDAPTWAAPAVSFPVLDDAGTTITDAAGGLFRDADAGTPAGVAVVAVTGAATGTWEYSRDDGASWLNLNDATAAAARLLGADDRVRYRPDPGFTGKVMLQLRAWDGSSGNAGGTANLVGAGKTGGATAFSPTILAATRLPNTAPTPGAAPTGLTTNEDTTSAAISVGSLVTNDADAGALKGVAVVGASGPGSWQYSLNGKTYVPLGAVSDAAARLLASTAKLRFVPAPNQAGAATLTYRAWDQTLGKSGAVVAIAATGGAYAFSASTVALTLEVESANDAPAWGAATVNMPFASVGGFGAGKSVAEVAWTYFADVDGDTPVGVAVVGVTGATSGTWEYSRDAGTFWQSLNTVTTSAVRLLAATDRIRFAASPGFTGKATVQLRAWDGTVGAAGETADLSGVGKTGGTTAFSATVLTATPIVNSAPSFVSLATPTFSTKEDVTSAAIPVASLVADVQDSDGPTVPTGVAIIGAAGGGTWQYSLNGRTWLPLGAPTQSSARLLPTTAKLRYTPAPNDVGPAGLNYHAWDLTAGTAGGVLAAVPNGGTSAFSSDVNPAVLTVNPVNDAPAVNPAAKPLLTPVPPGSDEPVGDRVGDLLAGIVGDADAGAQRGLAVTALTGAATGVWQYQLEGSSQWEAIGPVTATSALLLRDTDRLRYKPNADFLGSATLKFKAWDRSAGGTAGTRASTKGTAFSTLEATASVLVNTAPEFGV